MTHYSNKLDVSSSF